jgi:transposase InsO family protein
MGKEFTDRLFASRARAPSDEHEFDLLCTELEIEHRLTPPKSSQTNGMVERFNGRIVDVLKTNRFDSALDLKQTLMRCRLPFFPDRWRSRLTLQHAVAAISPEEPNTNAGHEGLAQTAHASFRQITVQSSGTRQLA